MAILLLAAVLSAGCQAAVEAPFVIVDRFGRVVDAVLTTPGGDWSARMMGADAPPVTLGPAAALAFDAGENQLAVSLGLPGDSQSAVVVYDIRSGAQHGSLLLDGSRPTRFAFHPRTTTLAIADPRGLIVLWNWRTPRPDTALPGRAPIAYTPDGGRLIVNTSNADAVLTFKAIDPRDGHTIPRFDAAVLRPMMLASPATLAAPLPDGSSTDAPVASIARYGQAVAWVERPNAIEPLPHVHDAGDDAAQSIDAAAGPVQPAVAIRRGARTHRWSAPGPVVNLAIAGHGHIVAAVGLPGDGTDQPGDEEKSPAVAPADTTASDSGCEAWVWRVGEQSLHRRIATGLEAPRGIAISDDGQLLAVWDHVRVVLLAVRTGRRVGELTHPQGVAAVSISPRGRYVAVGGDDGRVYIWQRTGLFPS